MTRQQAPAVAWPLLGIAGLQSQSSITTHHDVGAEGLEHLEGLKALRCHAINPPILNESSGLESLTYGGCNGDCAGWPALAGCLGLTELHLLDMPLAGLSLFAGCPQAGMIRQVACWTA